LRKSSYQLSAFSFQLDPADVKFFKRSEEFDFAMYQLTAES